MTFNPGTESEVPEAIIARIKKLQALSQNNANENEAAAAAAKMQDLLFKYEVEMSQVDGFELDAKPVGQERGVVINEGHRGVNWKVPLFTVVAETSLCTPLVSWYTPRPNFTRTNGTLIGRPGDIEMAKFTFNYLVAELERLVIVYLNGYNGYEHKTRARNSWLMGASAGVGRKLRTEFNSRRSESTTSFDLVVKRDAGLQAYMKEHYPKLGTYGSSVPDLDNASYNRGFETGRNLGVGRGIGDGGATKRIGG